MMVIIILYLEVLYIYSVITLDLVRDYERQKWLSLKLLERLNQAHLINKSQETMYFIQKDNHELRCPLGRQKMQGGRFSDFTAATHQGIPSLQHSNLIGNPGRNRWHEIQRSVSTFVSICLDTYLKRKIIFQPFTEIIFCWEEIKNKYIKTPGRWNSTSVFFIFWLKSKPQSIGKQ